MDKNRPSVYRGSYDIIDYFSKLQKTKCYCYNKMYLVLLTYVRLVF